MEARSHIISLIAEAKIRLSRGQSLFYDFKNALMIAAGLKILLNINLFQIIILTILCFIFFFIVGFIDLKYFKLFQEEAKLSTSKYNPHLNKLNKIVIPKDKRFKY